MATPFEVFSAIGIRPDSNFKATLVVSLLIPEIRDQDYIIGHRAAHESELFAIV